jgi:hypothetical protein
MSFGGIQEESKHSQAIDDQIRQGIVNEGLFGVQGLRNEGDYATQGLRNEGDYARQGLANQGQYGVHSMMEQGMNYRTGVQEQGHNYRTGMETGARFGVGQAQQAQKQWEMQNKLVEIGMDPSTGKKSYATVAQILAGLSGEKQPKDEKTSGGATTTAQQSQQPQQGMVMPGAATSGYATTLGLGDPSQPPAYSTAPGFPGPVAYQPAAAQQGSGPAQGSWNNPIQNPGGQYPGYPGSQAQSQPGVGAIQPRAPRMMVYGPDGTERNALSPAVQDAVARNTFAPGENRGPDGIGPGARYIRGGGGLAPGNSSGGGAFRNPGEQTSPVNTDALADSGQFYQDARGLGLGQTPLQARLQGALREGFAAQTPAAGQAETQPAVAQSSPAGVQVQNPAPVTSRDPYGQGLPSLAERAGNAATSAPSGGNVGQRAFEYGQAADPLYIKRGFAWLGRNTPGISVAQGIGQGTGMAWDYLKNNTTSAQLARQGMDPNTGQGVNVGGLGRVATTGRQGMNPGGGLGIGQAGQKASLADQAKLAIQQGADPKRVAERLFALGHRG